MALSFGWALALVALATVAVGVHGVQPAGAAPTFVGYNIPSGGGSRITVGPDGNLWFTENDANKIAKSTTSGGITEYTIPTSGSQPHGIAVGSDGNLWFTEQSGNKIGRITTAGVITEFAIPTAGAAPIGIAPGSDGNLWFVEGSANKIGKITTAGVITEYPIPTAATNPFDIDAGSDGNLWFTETSGSSVGRITTAGVITEFPMPGGVTTFTITAGPDNNLWAVGGVGLNRITTAGVITPFPTQNSLGINFVGAGPDGNLWYSAITGGFRVGTMTPSGTDVQYPYSHGLPGDVVAGLDGNVWIVGDQLVKVRLVPDPSGEFTSLTPARILDTRSSLGGHPGKVGQGSSFDVQITGQGGVPATGVAAVVLNVTVTEPTVGSFLTVWPAATSRPLASNVNYEPGQTVPNLVTVKVGAGGKVSVYNNLGATHVVMDVAGFYADSEGALGSRFHGVTPARILDTRNSAPVGQNATTKLDVTGVGGVPNNASVSGVVMNVTVTEPTASGYVTVWPDDASRPVVSNLNYTPGLTVPNLVTVRVPASGIVDFYNFAGSTHIVVDVVGFYDDDKSTEAGRFVAIDPFRIFDTRVSSPFPAPGKLPQGAALFVRPSAHPALPDTGMGSLVLNVTVTEPTSFGWVAVFPGDVTTLPLASNLNFVAGQTVPNLVIVKVGTGLPPLPITQVPGWVAFYNRFGATHLLADIAGYFTDSNVTPTELGTNDATTQGDTTMEALAIG